jgi:hypothetical protein
MILRSQIHLVIVAAVAIAGVARADQPSLDGKTFVGTMRLQNKPDTPAIPDTFIFAAGKLRSTSCDQYGFKAGPYTVRPDGTFEARTMSESAGTMRWSGSVRGGHLEGTVIWIHSRGGGEARYTIQGELARQ